MTTKLSNHTFFVDRMIFTNFYPEIKNNRLRLYLYICSTVGVNPSGRFFRSQVNTAVDLNITLNTVRKELKWLEDHYFIEEDSAKKAGRGKCYRVLVAPDYDKDTNKYFPISSIVRNRQSLKDSFHGYVELPIEFINGSILRDKTKWTDRKIKVYGQLYLYHWIDEFGGVDPDILNLNPNGVMGISSLLEYTLGCSKKQIENVVDWLQKEGHIQFVEVVYRKNLNSYLDEYQYIGDYSKVSTLPGDEIKKIIRMNIIPSLKVENARIRTAMGISI